MLLPHLLSEESSSGAMNSLSLRYAPHGLTKAPSPHPEKLEGFFFLPSRRLSLPSKMVAAKTLPYPLQNLG